MSEDDLGIAAVVHAEQALLGLCLNSSAAVAAARRGVGVADFWQPRHALIFGVLLDLADAEASIDPVRLLDELTRTKTLTKAGGAPYLHELFASPAAPANLGYYALQVRGAARRRQLAQIGARLVQIGSESTDTEDAMTHAASEALALELLLGEPEGEQAIGDLATWREMLAQPDRTEDWVIPGLLERHDVVMLLAGEGMGKSWLARQLCLAVAAGVHPFRPAVRIPRMRTLLVDLENAPSMVRRQSRGPAAQVARLGEAQGDYGYVWLHPEGLNLRTRADAVLLERVLEQTRPALVCLGPLGKAMLRGRDDWDTAAEEVRAVLDRLRSRYGCAWWLEHHMPKGDGHTRPALPFGSAVWQRWAGFGRVMTPIGSNAWELTPSFRGDRDQRDFPLGLFRGGDLPWSPIWDPEELDHLRKGGRT